MVFNFKRGGSVRGIDPGIYEATLTKVYEDKRNVYQSEEIEDVLNFLYEMETDAGTVTLSRKVRPFATPRSNLTSDLRAMAGSAKVDAVIGNDAALYELIQSLVGNKFLIQTDLTETGNVKIVKVMALPKGKVAVSASAQKKEDNVPDSWSKPSKKIVDDSDIPF